MKFEIVPTEKAVALREAFIKEFVDATSEHYQKHIATLRQCPDGLCYDGYLWDCLKDNDQYQKVCSMEAAARFLKCKESVFVMWDLFSNDRVRDGRRFSLEYPKNTVLLMNGNFLAQKLVEEWNREQNAWRENCQLQGLWLPEDIYCFDKSMRWYAIFTHEGFDHFTNPELDGDAYIRICFLHTQE